MSQLPSTEPQHKPSTSAADRKPPRPVAQSDLEDDTTEDEDDLDAGFQIQTSPSPRTTRQLPRDLLHTSTAQEIPSNLSPPSPPCPTDSLREPPKSQPYGEASQMPTPSPASSSVAPRRNNLNSVPPDSSSKPRKLGIVGSRRREEVRPDPVTPPVEGHRQGPEPASKPVKLGRIGGRRKEPSPTTDVEDTPMPDASSARAPPPARRRLGKIGGRREEPGMPAREQPVPRARSPEVSQETIALSIEDPSAPSKAVTSPPKPTSERPPPQPEETAEQKADRKREALKRDLDVGNVGGKKKRRF